MMDKQKSGHCNVIPIREISLVKFLFVRDKLGHVVSLYITFPLGSKNKVS